MKCRAVRLPSRLDIEMTLRDALATQAEVLAIGAQQATGAEFGVDVAEESAVVGSTSTDLLRRVAGSEVQAPQPVLSGVSFEHAAGTAAALGDAIVAVLRGA
jgi:hypothetical protein